MGRTIESGEWLRILRSDATPRHHLLCFPPGGGPATAYRDLAKHFGPGIVVAAVQYPGRQDRLAEPPITELDALADRIAEEVLTLGIIDGLTLFGHSMGATVAFETARRLERKGQAIRTLLVSGRPAPTFVETQRVHLGTDEDLIAELERLAADRGPIQMLRAEPSLAELVLPGVRGDYQAVETYRYTPGDPLAADIAAFVSTDDPTMTSEQADDWRDFTKGTFDRTTFPGGHFYLDERPAELAAAITQHLVRSPA
ncbi:surfactin synthase thioesterase subunit [Nocardia tenerifensis]|uniref:Thioesterase TesA n=1 Tax=Nocardia tenerifensis TaxID=228006 RepID=A0A318K823_9NOCA|nr:alpha/beta fold hydrolase [Nocardia tenerifensis]PXX70671.1 surfactin synthase thioesterase subunit [Nocardia tenerifensis]